MKYVNQKDYPYWIYYDNNDATDRRITTIARAGCGLCSAVMVADRLIPNNEFGLKDAVRIALETNSATQRGTTYTSFAPKFAEELGFDLEITSDTQRLLYCLRTGGAAVFLVNGTKEGHAGVFSGGLHYVTVISEERDGRVAIMDPSYFVGKYDKDGCRDLVTVKNNVIALCDMQVVIDEIPSTVPAFYLFWRK